MCDIQQERQGKAGISGDFRYVAVAEHGKGREDLILMF
jgi:hypothetical protein